MSKLTAIEQVTLERLASGDRIVFSQDGDSAWFADGDRAFVADEIFSLRQKRLIQRQIDPADETDNYRGIAEFDAITDAGRAALTGRGK